MFRRSTQGWDQGERGSMFVLADRDGNRSTRSSGRLSAAPVGEKGTGPLGGPGSGQLPAPAPWRAVCKPVCKPRRLGCQTVQVGPRSFLTPGDGLHPRGMFQGTKRALVLRYSF